MWWWWWWRRKAIEMWFHGLPNLYKRAKFYLFLSLHSAREELTWVGSVPFAKNCLVERIACKGTRCLNTAMLVSPHFKQLRCLHRNVSGFALSILSPPWLLEWPSPKKWPGFYLYYIKFQRQFTFPQGGSFGVIHNGSLCIQKCWSSCHTLNSSREFLRLWSRIPVLIWKNGIWSCLMIRWLTPVKTSNCEPLYSRLSSSKSQRDLYRAESISSGEGKSQHKPKRSLFAANHESTRQIAKLDSGQANVSRANLFLFKSVRRGRKKTFWLSADWSKNYYPR